MTKKRSFLAHLVGFPLLSFLAILGTTLLIVPNTAFAMPAASPLVALADSSQHLISQAQTTGHHSSSDQLTVGLALKTSNIAGQLNLLKSLYQPSSANYHNWLATGEYEARFAPAAADVANAKAYLAQYGLQLIASPSASLLLATGSTKQVEAAFHTTLNDYTMSNGRYFANSSAPRVSADLARSIVGVLGLNNVARARSFAMPDSKPNLSPPYGAGPYGRGLTPSQIAGIYDTTSVYKKLGDKGKGVTLGLYELSGYTRSDIRGYEKTFGLPNVPFIDKNILGGPIAIGGSVDYGAAEVELDIELQIATAPGAKKVLVYNAPNTELGSIGEYLQMAKDNQADSISTSWGLCEYFADSTIRTEELQAFTQMALQGQSIFDASGDNGAFDCGSSSSSGLQGADNLQVDDPADQPFITGVGGTSFRKTNGGAVTFNPGKNANPSYPGATAEWIWNRGCTPANCLGAGGGGVSRFWATADYVSYQGQILPGIIEPKYSQGGAYCAQTAAQLCRQVPDVSINADPGTGYAIYCTNVGGGCTDPAYSVKGWTRFGGTSCGAPIWAGIAALYDSYHHGRSGLFNYLVYKYDSKSGYTNQFHDITNGDNGYYPAGATYDMSSGIGTPDVYKLIKG